MPTPMLEVTGVQKYFPVRQSMLAALRRQPASFVKAIDGVTFAVAKGEVLALVGESGAARRRAPGRCWGWKNNPPDRSCLTGRSSAGTSAAGARA